MLNGWLYGESLSSATRHVCRKSTALLDDRRKQKWIWVVLLALAAYESYFVRALLAALFFLTILYVVFAPLPALYSFIAHAFYRGILGLRWSETHSILCCNTELHRLPEYRARPERRQSARAGKSTHRPTKSRRK
jgi:hypothetical protein